MRYSNLAILVQSTKITNSRTPQAAPKSVAITRAMPRHPRGASQRHPDRKIFLEPALNRFLVRCDRGVVQHSHQRNTHMFTKSIIRASGLGLVTALMMATGATGASAKQCHPYGTIIGSAGVAIKSDTAKKFARINWRVKVRSIATLGTAYTDWGRAEGRKYNCHKKRGTWRCSAVARPCR